MVKVYQDRVKTFANHSYKTFLSYQSNKRMSDDSSQTNTNNAVTADNNYSVPRTIRKVVGSIISNIKRSPGIASLMGKSSKNYKQKWSYNAVLRIQHFPNVWKKNENNNDIQAK
jgi:hypothetical protein